MAAILLAKSQGKQNLNQRQSALRKHRTSVNSVQYKNYTAYSKQPRLHSQQLQYTDNQQKDQS
jgi:hypothetical protein